MQTPPLQSRAKVVVSAMLTPGVWSSVEAVGVVPSVSPVTSQVNAPCRKTELGQLFAPPTAVIFTATS